jgi:hypothetical protein
MKRSRQAQRLLARMAAIERMERGKLCRMPGKPHYNLQAWRHGHNEVRYVRAEERAALQSAIDGYRLFTRLAEQYVDQIVKRTRLEHNKLFPPKPKSQKPKNTAP